jgi:superoxide dismutase, Fe-Mn family
VPLDRSRIMMTRRHALRALALSAAAFPLSSAAARDSTTAPPKSAGAPPATPPGPHTLPPLPYPYDALEPHLDAETMRIHHDRHHAAYVNNLNQALAPHPELAKRPVEDLLRDLNAAPEAIRAAVRNQGGGHANHMLLWASLKKGGSGPPAGALGAAIDRAFGGFAPFQERLAKAAGGVFGSGWAWLVARGGDLAVETTANQDSPLSAGAVPLLGIDVWEHAYYLRYQNRRPDYVAAFMKVIDWDAVSARYAPKKG